MCSDVNRVVQLHYSLGWAEHDGLCIGFSCRFRSADYNKHAGLCVSTCCRDHCRTCGYRSYGCICGSVRTCTDRGDGRDVRILNGPDDVCAVDFDPVLVKDPCIYLCIVLGLVLCFLCKIEDVVGKRDICRSGSCSNGFLVYVDRACEVRDLACRDAFLISTDKCCRYGNLSCCHTCHKTCRRYCCNRLVGTCPCNGMRNVCRSSLNPVLVCIAGFERDG